LKVRRNRREEKNAEGQRREEEEQNISNYCMDLRKRIDT
jgi:hypothetical protein